MYMNNQRAKISMTLWMKITKWEDCPIKKQQIHRGSDLYMQKRQIYTQNKCLFQWVQNAAPSKMAAIQCDQPADPPENGALSMA